MLLDRMDISKSSGADKLPKKITPVVHYILLNHFALARWRDKLAGGLQAGSSNSPH